MVRTKGDAYFLGKVLTDIDYLLLVTKDVSKESLEVNETLVDSVMFRFIQISENLKRVSDKLKSSNPSIKWREVIGLRNRIVHDYGNIDLTIIYEVLKYDLEDLHSSLTLLVK